jgi:3-hydroxyisobutyrate dehydrogenase-like beta-hydroxyacid dehydrogenase
MTTRLDIALIGYGEVGGIFGAALAKADGHAVFAFDVLIDDASWAANARAHASADNVALTKTNAEAVAHAQLIISAVTAAATTTAAAQIARDCPRDAFVLDVNSASPRTKTQCAAIIERAGGRYVEAAVMTSVPPHGLRVPTLLGGPHATALEPTLAKLGFAARVGSESYGVVSAIKLCRSVFIKGMEALAIEGLLTARRYGVEDEVLASLAETFPGIDWERQASWFWQRVVQHGRRRAEEMREAGVAVADAGFDSRMALATAELQAWIAALRADGVFDGAAKNPDWRALADLIEREPPDR